ncbi:MAG TPA: winged helix-turn-helix domain-containing protein, partial [Woeseiaceae bacterium]|nr:winged helix-turn-helix domain-containing protein [Woeseiaceae bacterium]
MVYEFGDCRIDAKRREIRRGGRTVEAEPRTLDLLLYFLSHRDRVITKDELQDAVWGTIVTDTAVARGVMKARKILGDSPDDPHYISTVRGHGYRFIGELRDEHAATNAPAGPALGEDRRSIAVLPFANLTGEAANQYFSDGIAEEILNLLARIAELRVSSRTSSFCFRDSMLDLRTIAAKLGVEFLLQGSLRRDGARVRVAIQLIDAKDDAQVLSQVFERELVDVLRLQAEIASEVVARLPILSGPPVRPHSRTANLQAYEYYLRGRHYFYLWDGRSLEYAKLMYRKAIELDPHFAKAWAGLAETLAGTRMWQEAGDALLAEATDASLKAVKLGPELAESHCARGFVLSLHGDYAGAAREFGLAIERDPMFYEAWYLFGRSRFSEGKPVESARLFQAAGAVRPDEYQASCLAVLALQRAGNQAEVPAAATEAVRRCRDRLELRPDDTRALTLGAGALTALELNDEAIAWVERALVIRPDDVMVLHNAGCTLAALGEVDRALDVFEKRFRLGTAFADWI